MPKTKPRKIVDPALPRLAFTVTEFCDAARISESSYYRLKQRGLAPREMEILGRRLIAFSEAERWIADQIQATSERDAAAAAADTRGAAHDQHG
jgi:predicted DNA-binding transcriptional regulator AlpA